jgi:mRNA-degrading endonuclease toxin of MazEF toxin-antitoxin module
VESRRPGLHACEKLTVSNNWINTYGTVMLITPVTTKNNVQWLACRKHADGRDRPEELGVTSAGLCKSISTGSSQIGTGRGAGTFV